LRKNSIIPRVILLVSFLLPLIIVALENYDLLVSFALLIFILFLFILLQIYKQQINLTEFVLYFVIFWGMLIMSAIPEINNLQGSTLVIFAILILFYYVSVFNLSEIKKYSFFSKKDAYLFITFLILFFISVIIFNFKDILRPFGISKIICFIGLGTFFTLIIPKYFVSYPNRFNYFIKILLITGGIFSLLGIISFINPFLVTQRPGFSTGFFQNPNTNAYFSSFYMPISLYLILYRKEYLLDKNKYYFTIFLFILMIINLLLSSSRAGYLGSALSISILLFIKSKKRFIIILFLIIIISSQILPFLVLKGGSTFARAGLLYSAIIMLKSSLTGFLWGFGSISVFSEYSYHKQMLGGMFDPIDYPHNAYLFFIMQFGLLSFIPLTLIFLKYFYLNLRSIILKRNYDSTLYLVIAIFTSILGESIFEDTILFPNFFVYPLFLIFFGLFRIIINSEATKKYEFIG